MSGGKPGRRIRRLPPSEILTGVVPLDVSPLDVGRRFRAELARGAKLRPAGTAKDDPSVFTGRRYGPRHMLRLFGATIYLTGFRYDSALGFLIAYVQLDRADGKPSSSIYPRIFYKDSSLVWRVASHFVHDEDEYWIGKGDVRTEVVGEHEYVVTVEETTNLPFEIQFALDGVSRVSKRVKDNDAVALVLREGASGRLKPYPDFLTPRRHSAEKYAIHGGRSVARFRRAGDPSSLEFTGGYGPDFGRGVLESSVTMSRFFGGELQKVRILSVNRRIQYLFFSSPTHTWVNPPQALSIELSTYGVRTVDVRVDDDLCVPGYEYHEESASQIPDGYAGDPHPDDPHRADASKWLRELPVIREFLLHQRQVQRQVQRRRTR